MIANLWQRIAGWFGLLGGLVITVLTLLRVGRRQGRAQAEQKQERADMSAVEVSRDAAETIERLDDDAVRDRARKRMRDTEGR